MPLPPEFWEDPPPKEPKEPLAPPPETDSQKRQRLLLQALQAPGGRGKLAASMATTIRDKLRGRFPRPQDFIPVEPMPQGAQLIYDRSGLLPWDAATDLPGVEPVPATV